MAITATHYELFKSLPLPRGGSLLEIGEANWYGDLDPREFIEDYDLDENGRVLSVNRCQPSENLFAIAKAFYAATFAPSRIVSIDMNGTPAAFRIDLNEDFRDGWTGNFDVVINHGTAEHIFNIGQVFRTMHDHCEAGGLMVHDAPFTGWLDHGFYNLHPTLFYDLAAANNYEVVKVAIHEISTRRILPVETRESITTLAEAGEIPLNSMLFVALRKTLDAAFRIPVQGYYAGALSEAEKQEWQRVK